MYRALLLAAWLLVGQAGLAIACQLHPTENGEVTESRLLANGLTLFVIDTDGDGEGDRALLYQPDGAGDLWEWPLFYLEGYDPQTDRAEEVWIDRGTRGICWEIWLYWSRSIRAGSHEFRR